MQELENIRADLEYDKLIAVIPESYFVFHRGVDHESAGFIIQPLWRGSFLGFKYGFLGGSWNIAFVHEDQLDKGTLSHELAHTLGQGREFYEDHERCRHFRGNSDVPCETFQIPRALDTWTQGRSRIWEFIENKFSIMLGSKGILGTRKIDLDVNNTWIDKDTYQKTFDVLSSGAVASRRTALFGESIVRDREYKREKSSSLKAVISGFYYEKDDTLIIPKTKVKKTKLLTPSFVPKIENTELPVLTFQLREGKSLLQKIKRPVIEMEFKTLYKDKPPQTEPFNFSPFMVVFKLPENYKERKLQIDVLNPKGEKIYTAPIQKMKNREQGELSQIDKIQ